MMRKYDVCLLLGLQLLEDGSPREELVSRVRLGAQCVREGLCARVIACGGDTGMGVSEAAVMRELLLREGVREELITMEDRSVITCENLRNALKLLKAGERVLIVTSDYHLARARLMAWKEGRVFAGGRAVRTPLGMDKLRAVKIELYATVDYLLFWGGRDAERPAWAEQLKRFLLARNARK